MPCFLCIQKLLRSFSSTQSKKNSYNENKIIIIMKTENTGYMAWIKFRCISVANAGLDQKRSLFKSCEQLNERFGEAHCLMIVRTGINKNLSTEAIFDADEVLMKGIENIVSLQLWPPISGLHLPLGLTPQFHCSSIYKLSGKIPLHDLWKGQNCYIAGKLSVPIFIYTRGATFLKKQTASIDSITN